MISEEKKTIRELVEQFTVDLMMYHMVTVDEIVFSNQQAMDKITEEVRQLNPKVEFEKCDSVVHWNATGVIKLTSKEDRSQGDLNRLTQVKDRLKARLEGQGSEELQNAAEASLTEKTLQDALDKVGGKS